MKILKLPPSHPWSKIIEEFELDSGKISFAISLKHADIIRGLQYSYVVSCFSPSEAWVTMPVASYIEWTFNQKFG